MLFKHYLFEKHSYSGLALSRGEAVICDCLPSSVVMAWESKDGLSACAPALALETRMKLLVPTLCLGQLLWPFSEGTSGWTLFFLYL